MNKFIPQYHPQFGTEEALAVQHYMNSCLTSNGGWLTEYKNTREFEEMICDFLDVTYCSVVCNGTISLSIALLALGVRPGDEVIIPDLTMIATANAVKFIGAIPVLSDIEPETLCLDVNRIENIRTERTKAIIFVSLNGRSDILALENLKTFCHRNNLGLIEDAAQSFGSKYHDKYIGTYGDIGSFSFSPYKIITTGQGGALITNDTTLARRIKQLKDFGRMQGGEDNHSEFGVNAKFTDLQAVVGIEQLRRINERIRKKRYIYELYYKLLSQKITFHRTITIPEDNRAIITSGGEAYMFPLTENHVPWFVDIYVADSFSLTKFLVKKFIGTRKMYSPLHSHPWLNSPKDFPISIQYSQMGLWLPSSFDLEDEEIEYICNVIKEFYHGI